MDPDKKPTFHWRNDFGNLGPTFKINYSDNIKISNIIFESPIGENSMSEDDTYISHALSGSVTIEGCEFRGSPHMSLRMHADRVDGSVRVVKNCKFTANKKNAISYTYFETDVKDYITNCEFSSNSGCKESPIRIYKAWFSHDIKPELTISGCSINSGYRSGIKIQSVNFTSSYFQCWEEGIVLTSQDNTYNNINKSAIDVIIDPHLHIAAPVTIKLIGENIYNNFTTPVTISDSAEWWVHIITTACPTCPTYFQTPNYPSDYNDNDNFTQILNAPGNDGYYIKVYGKVESNYDYLYIKELDGTIIGTVTGTKKYYPYYKWIDSNRSVKVQFISDYSINYEGYDVTVLD